VRPAKNKTDSNNTSTGAASYAFPNSSKLRNETDQSYLFLSLWWRSDRLTLPYGKDKGLDPAMTQPTF